MGIFIGETRCNDAVDAALNISGVVQEVLNPELVTLLYDQKEKWKVAHRSGIDDGEAFIVRGGARDNSDLVSIGIAPNIAAKLSAVRDEPGSITITKRVYDALFDRNKALGDQSIWTQRSGYLLSGHVVTTYNSHWMRKP